MNGIGISLRRLLTLSCWLLGCAFILRAQSGSDLRGVVLDSTGAALAGASVSVLGALQAPVATAQSDAQGRFAFHDLAPGAYELLAILPGFAPKRQAVRMPLQDGDIIEIKLGVADPLFEVTVTADLGTVQPVHQTTQQVNVIDEARLEERVTTVLAQAAQEEAGLQLQRTSPTIAAIFVRGVTGAKVANYLDGIRFSTAAARGGINTFFDLNEMSNLRGVEVLRGPNSAQFGSDSIGGAVHLLSRVPLFTTGQVETHGQIGTHYFSADHGFGGNTLASLGGRNLAVLINLMSHRSNTLRSGGGFDTHSAVDRFLGLRSDRLLGERSTDTAFTQYGGLFKLIHRLRERNQISLHYQRTQIDGGKRFDQTIGGDGNLIADLRNFMLDFFYGRYQRFGAGPFDSVALSYSYNVQREERVNQGDNGNPTGVITHQPERTAVHGIQAQAARHWLHHDLVIGGDFYRDRIRTDSYTFDPASNAFSIVRGRVPDKSRYRSGGAYAQGVWNAIPRRLRLVAALRYGRAAYESRAANSPLMNGQPLWPDDELAVHSITPRFGAAVTVDGGITLSGQVSRGFRAPHITDLGTLGLTGNGFEANAVDLAGKGATIGTAANASAVSTGIAAARLRPETSWCYEGGIHLRRGRMDFDASGFVNDIYDNIVLQTLVLPPGAVDLQLGDQRVVSQSASGLVFVAASTNPVLIRANLGDSRIQGIEQKFEARITRSLTFGENFTFLHAEDKRTGRPPTIEGGTPAPQGNARLRYGAPGGRFWAELYFFGARKQDRLSTLDLDDRRTGASRSRASIQNFFRRGATVRGLVAAGADGRFGTADDTLIATRETLSQVQDRVLGSAASAPLFAYIPGFVTLGVRGGFRVGERHHLFLALENPADRNYRGISWGLDGPGRSFGFRYSYRF
jgi:outer membrane receptor protein involved in Fe transport